MFVFPFTEPGLCINTAQILNGQLEGYAEFDKECVGLEARTAPLSLYTSLQLALKHSCLFINH